MLSRWAMSTLLLRAIILVLVLGLTAGLAMLLPSAAAADVPRPPGPGCQRCAAAAPGSLGGPGLGALATAASVALAGLLLRRRRRDD